MPTLSNEELARKIENIIQDAEVAAALDKSMYAEMDNQLMNRQTLLSKIKALFATHNTALLKEVADKVIGEDDRDYSQDNADRINLKILVATSTACNELRAEQRSKLAAMGGQKEEDNMNIYLVERSEWDYDEFDGFVVAAVSSIEALGYLEAKYNSKQYYNEWPNKGEKTATLIGTSDKYKKTEIILGSYHAG